MLSLSGELHIQLYLSAEHFSWSSPETHSNTGIIVDYVKTKTSISLQRGLLFNVISLGLTVSHGLNVLVGKVVKQAFDQVIADD